MRRKTLATMAKHSFAEHNLLVEAESLDESGKTNMNAIQILMVDHEEAITMIDALLAGQLVGAAAAEAGEMKATDVTLFERLKEALKLHTTIEEHIFYPALEDLDETRDLIKESYHEHQEVDQLLEKMIPGDPAWDDQIAELKRKIEHHAREEERILFPKAEELLGEK